eukprot:gnl/MRDRNA2_/MRDRNA2_117261_c0_seq1.p1 gnl/MRDRNA2_/MRDRNA2_117261_c0~~gnl/MRDRNA2_/MRDRNA2_117261_c0_seq1.p1  ORF type:complete len:447 (+),score=87.58 gnl/MRDRNA2_/MRDRNA2_117261_c0_seq1:158-1498(+)
MLGLLHVFLILSSIHGENVVSLTEQSWEQFFTVNSRALVEFHAPWCGQCKKLAPEYEAAAGKLKGTVPLVKVDATVHTNLAEKFGINGFPTLVWIENGASTAYDGGRSGEHIVQWVQSMTGSAVVSVEAGPELHGNETLPFVTLWSPQLLPVFEEVAKANRHNATWYHVATQDGSASRIVVQHRFEEAVVMTEGLDSKETITAFFANHSFPLFGLLESDSFSRYMDRGLGVVWAMFPMKEDDHIEEVVQKDRAMMTKVATALLGRYSVIYTDTNQFRDAIENMLGVSEFPAIVVHKKAGDKKKFIHDGPMDADKIIEFVSAVEAGKVDPKLKSESEPERNDGPVKVVVGTTLKQMVFTEDKDVLLQIYALWCGHCKKLEPEFVKVGKKAIKDGISDILTVAKLDGTANDSPVDSIAWTGFPTIYYVKAGSKEPLRHEGERTARSMW